METCSECSVVRSNISNLNTEMALEKNKREYLEKEVAIMREEQRTVMGMLTDVQKTLNKAYWVFLGGSTLISVIYTFHEPIAKLIGVMK